MQRILEHLCFELCILFLVLHILVISFKGSVFLEEAGEFLLERKEEEEFLGLDLDGGGCYGFSNILS